MDHEKNLFEYLLIKREEGFAHTSFDIEMAVYDSISLGDIETVRMLAQPLCCEGCGILSKNELRNIQYHFVITAAMVARFCIRSGMTTEEAYHLSDYYIMKADECHTVNEVHALHSIMLEDYTRKMRRVRNTGIYSKKIIQALDYVSDHLHNRILLEDVADHLQMSTAYLSRLFKSEVGMNFIDYVHQKKAEAAANLLRLSKYSDLEISNLLCFSSQSYFIKVFKKHMGITPKEFKKAYRMPDFQQ